MKILYATPLLPFPVEQGHQMIGYNRIRALARLGHEVTLIAFYRQEEHLEQNQQELSGFVKQLIAIKLPRWQPAVNVATSVMFSQTPIQVLYFKSAAFQRAVEKLRPDAFDVIHINTFRLAPYFLKYANKCVLDLLDSMILNISKRLSQEKGLNKIIYGLELSRVKKYESEIVRKFPLSLVVGEADRQTIQQASGHAVVRLPLAVDETIFRREGPLPFNKTIIFSGNMAYTPNIDAVKWFVEHCWGLIKAAVKEAEFHVIGANPTAETLAYGQRPGIKIVGRVPSMPVALNQAQLAVAPMQIGSGMQSKILEAMACGLPMVCTPFCIEPIGARPGHEVLAAQEPAAFAEACIELLRNEDKCLEISRNATAFIAREYGNEANARELVGLYRQVIDRQNG